MAPEEPLPIANKRIDDINSGGVSCDLMGDS
jgi:hypothetical protein